MTSCAWPDRLVARGRDDADRRAVRVALTAAGAALLRAIGDAQLTALHARQFTPSTAPNSAR